ncbi:Protein disulfide-isomerase-like 2-2 [Coelomomyces lativittatus]|nr:Protein disulfide-isomerase-like 2-2 [Coelomomyces lativittatus]
MLQLNINRLHHSACKECPYCQALVPKFEAASKELETTFPNVAFVNADCIAYPVFLNKFNITGYPTLMWFDTKSNPLSSPGELYQMKHSKEDIVNFVKSKAGASNEALHRRSEPVKPAQTALELTSKNFNEQVSNPQKIVFVMFYAPWCGWCKKAHPIVNELAGKFANKPHVVIATLDATVHSAISNEYKIQGYPTFKLFGPNFEKPLDYNGDRTLEAFYDFVEQHSKLDDAIISDKSLGLLESMEPHVQLFMTDTKKSVVFKKIEDTLGPSVNENHMLYLDIMRKVMEKGANYLENELKRLKANIDARGSFSFEKLKSFVMRSNILKAFRKYSEKTVHSEL